MTLVFSSLFRPMAATVSARLLDTVTSAFTTGGVPAGSPAGTIAMAYVPSGSIMYFETSP